ncbi:MAG: hypothetical protein U1F60_02675 [Planctomycetota bacterium]
MNTVPGRRRAAVLLRRITGICLAAIAAACSSTPGDNTIARFTTHPAGATVFIEAKNLKMTTPCDLDFEVVAMDDMLVVSKPGFRTARVLLSDVPQVAVASFELQLEKQ